MGRGLEGFYQVNPPGRPESLGGLVLLKWSIAIGSL